jgi:hypothetical protein
VARFTVSLIYLHFLLKRRNVAEIVVAEIVVVVEDVVITNVDKADRLCYSQKEQSFVKCKRAASVALHTVVAGFPMDHLLLKLWMRVLLLLVK